MSKFTNPLKNISVASPCSQDWNAMIGNERKRYCGDCKLNVYNLSGMSRTEAENLIIDSEGRLCVRFYRRADGSILTKDCPVGWQAIKRRVSRMAVAVFSLIVGLITGLGFSVAFNKSKEIKLGRFLPVISPTPEHTMGVMLPPTPSPTPKASPKQHLMGDIAAPSPTPKPKDEEILVGKLVAPKN